MGVRGVCWRAAARAQALSLALHARCRVFGRVWRAPHVLGALPRGLGRSRSVSARGVVCLGVCVACASPRVGAPPRGLGALSIAREANARSARRPRLATPRHRRLMLTIMLFVERFLAAVLLSKLPMYYEGKLLLMVWLMKFEGAGKLYRQMRVGVENAYERAVVVLPGLPNILPDDNAEARQNLKLMRRSGAGDVVKAGLSAYAAARRWRRAEREHRQSERDSRALVAVGEVFAGGDVAVAAAAAPDWEEVDEPEDDDASKLYHVCEFVLSKDGRELCEEKNVPLAERALLDQRASAVLSFQPRFVVAALLPYEDGDADLPSMDDNGLADPYVVIRIQVHAHADHLSRAARRRAHQRGAGGRGARVVLVYA